MSKKVEIEAYHIENFKYAYFALRDDETITQIHINEIMDEYSTIYYEVTGIDLTLEERDLED